MNLKTLLEGSSVRTTTYGPECEIIRMIPRLTDPEFRKVKITYAQVTVRQTFAYPWKDDVISKGWDVRAQIILKDGRTFSARLVSWLDFYRSIELVALEAVKKATLAKVHTLEARLAV